MTEARASRRDRRRDPFSSTDRQIIGRVLRYAQPYRGKIILALFLGMLAGTLAALNIVALIPVLDIMLSKDDKNERIVQLDKRIAELEAKIAKKDGFFESIKPRFTLAGQHMKRDFIEWGLRYRERVVYWLGGLLILATFLKGALEFKSKQMNQKAFLLAVQKIKNDLYDRCLELDLAQVERHGSGDLIARLNNDMRQLKQIFTSMMSDVVQEPFNVVALLATLFIMNWQLTLIVMFGLPIIVLPISYAGKRLRSMGRKDEEEDSKILGFSQEVIQGLLIVKAFVAERREMKRFRTITKDMVSRQIRRESMRLLADPVVEVSSSIAMAAVIWVGAYVILKSDHASMTPAEFIVYLFILTRFYPPIKKITSAFVKLQKSLGSAERIFEVIDTEPTLVEKPEAITIPLFSDRIEFKDVTFAYANGKVVLPEFNLVIPRGKRIAIVGKTGAGKTTAVRLLPRLYDVSQGSVMIDGVDVRDATLKSLRSQIGIVSQETILFNDTILNNIRYARPDATIEQVEAAAKAAYADEFIETLSKGYETVVGERGGQLSGGQRQRVAIARALLADTPILIFDEATSALDNESEAIVQRAIDRLMENRTVIVIAHRLSTVRKADEIIVMFEGRIAERGTHEELVAARGRYWNFLKEDEIKDE